MKQNLETVGEPSNELYDHQSQDKQNLSKNNIQQDQDKKQQEDKKQQNSENMHQTSDQASNPACSSCANTDDQLEQDSSNDDGTDQHHIQNDNDYGDGDANVKKKPDTDGNHQNEVNLT